MLTGAAAGYIYDNIKITCMEALTTGLILLHLKNNNIL
jgi:hypothetical protein